MRGICYEDDCTKKVTGRQVRCKKHAAERTRLNHIKAQRKWYAKTTEGKNIQRRVIRNGRPTAWAMANPKLAKPLLKKKLRSMGPAELAVIRAIPSN